MMQWMRIYLCLGLLCGPLAAQTPYADLARFYDEQGTPFVEIYLGIETGGLSKVRQQRQYTSRVQLRYRLLSLPDSTPVLDRTETLGTTPVADTTLPAEVLRLQLVQALKPGNYGLEISCSDANTPQARTYSTRRFFYVTAQEETFRFSDICLVDSVAPTRQPTIFTKNNREVYPLGTDAVLIQKDSLRFYVELYKMNALIKEPYYLDIYLTQAGKTERQEQYRMLTRPSRPNAMSSVLMAMNTAELQDGLYVLHIEARTNSGKLLGSTEKNFEVLNQYIPTGDENILGVYDRLYGYTEAELSAIIPQLQPVSNSLEVDFARSLKTFEEKKNYFVSFWQKRAQGTSQEPGAMALDYLKRLAYVNHNFKTANREGWRTDMGRVMLTYGPPNNINNEENNADQYPHQIWNYNSLKGQNAVYFVFADFDLTGKNYRLLHSTLTTEVQNASWQLNLQRNSRRTPAYSTQDNGAGDPINPQNR